MLTAASQEFEAAFVALCQTLRPSRSSAHLFLIRTDDPLPVHASTLIDAARECHVAVHAVSILSDDPIHEVTNATGGFYTASDQPAKTLAGFYRGISHRYVATFLPGRHIRQVRVAVRTKDAFGESAPWEMSEENGTGIS
jgi:hypothetical protein